MGIINRIRWIWFRKKCRKDVLRWIDQEMKSLKQDISVLQECLCDEDYEWMDDELRRASYDLEFLQQSIDTLKELV